MYAGLIDIHTGSINDEICSDAGGFCKRCVKYHVNSFKTICGYGVIEYYHIMLYIGICGKALPTSPRAVIIFAKIYTTMTTSIGDQYLRTHTCIFRFYTWQNKQIKTTHIGTAIFWRDIYHRTC